MWRLLGSIVLYVRHGVYVHFGESLPDLGNCPPNMGFYG
nr:MAG TPA: hypothetical protein [Caudoviricetes sp.]